MKLRRARLTLSLIKQLPVEPVIGVALFAMTLGTPQGTSAASDVYKRQSYFLGNHYQPLH